MGSNLAGLAPLGNVTRHNDAGRERSGVWWGGNPVLSCPITPASLPSPPSFRSILIAAWAFLGFGALLAEAMVRLIPASLAPIIDGPLRWWQAMIYVSWVAFLAYVKGYWAFQKSFAPRFVVRALYAGAHPSLVRVLLATPFAMSLFHTERRRLIISWLVVAGIVAAVLLLRVTPQPWRGIIDGGVVVGLTWGFAAMLISFVRAVSGRPVAVDAALPLGERVNEDAGFPRSEPAKATESVGD